MSSEPQTPQTAETEEVKDLRTSVTLRYASASQVVAEGGKSTLALYADEARGAVRGGGRVKEPLRLREALSALHDVVSSDFRYVPKDRSAYLAYMRLRKQATGMNVAEAQRAYIDWIQRNDPLAFALLDPIVTVHPDELFFEVFSKDEGSYAKLAIDWSALDDSGAREFGTTNIDFSQALIDGVQRMRSYRETRVSVGAEAVALSTTSAPEVIEKKVQVPDTWLRGFLQVQSAGTLPRTVFHLAPVDLYNALRHLRLSADTGKAADSAASANAVKGAPPRRGRGIRIELVPGEPPRLCLEPWETVITSTSGAYTGSAPQVVRIWGRRRLMLLRRLLPFIESIEVHLLGSGLPSFYVLRMGALTFTLGLSGFTSSNWAQAVSFDLLLPRRATSSAYEQVLKHLQGKWFASVEEITKELGLTSSTVLEALQVGCQNGKLMFDVARGVYRYRPLTTAEIDPSRFEFRNDRERRAHDLCAEKGAVRIASENRIFGVGVELVGKIAVTADKREYRTELVIEDDGRVKKADCTCAFFRKHQLKEGPCEHLIALRLAEAREEERRRAERGASRSRVTVETRTYQKRTGRGEDIVQIAFDHRSIKLRFGPRGREDRIQRFFFNSVDDARAAYFARIDELEKRGFLDATAS